MSRETCEHTGNAGSLDNTMLCAEGPDGDSCKVKHSYAVILLTKNLIHVHVGYGQSPIHEYKDITDILQT